MDMDATAGIVKKTEPLSEDYLSGGFPGREKQAGEVEEHLASVARRRKPQPIWICGPPGAGKTSTVKRALFQLEDPPLRTVLVVACVGICQRLRGNRSVGIRERSSRGTCSPWVDLATPN